jgi:nucleotide-binding universal stress UspA family protein
MEGKLITLAIRTFDKAEVLKAVLEGKGIRVEIHNLDSTNSVAVGVRVRIQEKDLAKALGIIEAAESTWFGKISEDLSSCSDVLLPIDFNFSEVGYKAIDCGFQFADSIGAEIVFMHIYHNPVFSISSENDLGRYSISDGNTMRKTLDKITQNIETLTASLKERIESKKLPDIPFRFELKEGIPEDEILLYCKKKKPSMVIMDTHGKKLSDELLGSVTAEVMEYCQSPVLALPIESSFSSVQQINRVAFLTNFNQKDLIAIDRIIGLLQKDNLDMHFIHSSADKPEAWDEVILGGIKSYFSSHYPSLVTHYSFLESDEKFELLDKYITDNQIDVLAFNSRKRNIFSRLFHSGLSYKMVLHTDTPILVTHV